jgi:hypothetical protein
MFIQSPALMYAALDNSLNTLNTLKLTTHSIFPEQFYPRDHIFILLALYLDEKRSIGNRVPLRKTTIKGYS